MCPSEQKDTFTSHTAAVARLLHGYHVQITARSDRDLTPESIIQKVADASGSKYSSSGAPQPVAATKPSVASKLAFTPTQSSSAGSGFNPMARNAAPRQTADVDEDGWGADAPQVTRTQLEKVAPAYQPTKVDMRNLSSQQPAASAFSASQPDDDRPGVVRGAYQPVGKVDIAAIRRQAKESGGTKDDRPQTVKGSYEPVGKVDIAAIRARAQKPDDSSFSSRPEPVEEPAAPKPVAERSAAFSQGPERLTSLPKPKVGNKFGGGTSFGGTKAPMPGGFEAKSVAPAAPVGAASRTFADQGGKTPAQIWAEKKARERGTSGSGGSLPQPGYGAQSPIQSQTSGGGQWESGYSGKKWGSVQTTHTGKSRDSIGQQLTGEQAEEDAPASPAGGIGSIRDRFSGAPPMGAPASFYRVPPPAPEPDTTTKPNRGIPIPGLPQTQEREAPSLPTPPPQPRSPTPPTPEAPSGSPIRIAMPVAAGAAVADAREEQTSPPPALPAASLGRAMPEPEPEDDEPESGPDPGRGAASGCSNDEYGTRSNGRGTFCGSWRCRW